MASIFNMFKTLFDVRSPDQRDQLAVAQFHGVCDAFEQLRARMPTDTLTDDDPGRAASDRALVFYALAAARMQLAEQLHVALHEEMQSPSRPRRSQARMDLEDLTGQIDVLTLAASLELAQSESTAGTWEILHHLRDAITPPPEADRGEDTVAHARAMYNGGMVLLTQLQQQLKEREQAAGSEKFATARMLLAAAQHEFDTIGPLASQLQSDPGLFGLRDSAMHEELEAQVERMVRLLESVAAELAVSGVTQTPLWQDLLGDPRSLATGAGARAAPRRGVSDRPWERDIWCMSSELFQRTHRDDARAIRVLQDMWAGDPDPARTWTLYDSVLKLETEGAVRPIGSFFNACPWTPIWRAERTVRVGNKVVSAGRDFCLHVESEPDGEFARDVIIADFVPTDEIDYCDTEDSRHDER